VPTFETDRLILRRLQEGDAEALHREIYSDHDVVRYYNGDRVFSLEEVREFLPRRRNIGQFGYWTVTLKETGEPIGQVHIDPYANLGWHPLPEDADLLCQSPEVHLGFAFGKRFWGHGYAFEACRRLVLYAFQDLRLRRLLGGAAGINHRSVRLHERLGFHVFSRADDVVAVMVNPLAAYRMRLYEERDREAANATGSPVLDWWHNEVPGASIHLVAEEIATGEIVGQIQARDRSVPEPSRRPGQCHFMLSIRPEHRRRGLGRCLYDQVEEFARSRKVTMLYCAYHETPDAPAAPFLREREFEPIERFLPSSIDLSQFDPAQFADAVTRVEQQGITLTTYAAIGDSAEHRQELYALEEAARATQPFREVEPYISTAYPKWEAEFADRDQTTVFLALAPGTREFVGVVTGLEWYFTGVHPDWRGRGIAMALKVLCMQEAKARGMERMETENHEDNATMLAVNRKLGYVFGYPEVACIKRLDESGT
jgi:RimJ/RimL family protein N-acetyltransferase